MTMTSITTVMFMVTITSTSTNYPDLAFRINFC